MRPASSSSFSAETTASASRRSSRSPLTIDPADSEAIVLTADTPVADRSSRDHRARTRQHDVRARDRMPLSPRHIPAPQLLVICHSLQATGRICCARLERLALGEELAVEQAARTGLHRLMQSADSMPQDVFCKKRPQPGTTRIAPRLRSAYARNWLTKSHGVSRTSSFTRRLVVGG